MIIDFVNLTLNSPFYVKTSVKQVTVSEFVFDKKYPSNVRFKAETTYNSTYHWPMFLFIYQQLSLYQKSKYFKLLKTNSEFQEKST